MPQHYRIPLYKVSLVRDGGEDSPIKTIGTALDAAQVFRTFLKDVDREHFLVMMLDQKHKIIGINVVSIGSLTMACVHPREVFKPAIISNAAALIVGHNHPSGAPEPSQEDRTLTKRLVDAGDLLGIAVLDHVIVGDGTERYYSFADTGTLRC